MPPATTASETVKDNQWWFSKSDLREVVEPHPFIELTINGRTCLLQRSADSKSGVPTWSFKFLTAEDRQHWQSLRGKTAKIVFVAGFNQHPAPKTGSIAKQPSAEIVAANISDGQATLPLESSNIVQVELGQNVPLFDAYVFIDWSANNTPKTGKDSIWIAEGFWHDNQLQHPQNFEGCFNAPTRDIATKAVNEILNTHLSAGRRTLICFDFPYCFPACKSAGVIAKNQQGFAQRISELLVDDASNRSNRFQVADRLNELIGSPSKEGPFWGRPTTGDGATLKYLRSTKPKDWNSRSSLVEFRTVEVRLRQRGKNAFSIWQLFGAGSVGSQALVGLPRVFALRNAPEFVEHSRIWPFETGWCSDFDPNIRIVHGEFWPGAVPIHESLHPIRDAAQVKSCVIWAAQQDAAGKLGNYFDPLNASDPERRIAVQEGWILGFTDKDE